ncbi:class I SAM-dependent methyltransferase [Shewanella sp. CG18_big_fil_WC_8_21_14_2_50_42_11]|uniref:class I SAM-dependent methyltransferase n=1 Tax=Shewanella sp. CG18_big_fil_WC_8_21_14_2_50_42_11 TaxID=1975538 RepID=UPI00257DF529|nr:class I SAM-dependent methyltransferase [Shewanella sp. CG18_big_fil_WC_8_21_14_2_50_42_11]
MLNLEIPLFYKTHEVPGNGPFPVLFPFTLAMDEETGLPCQQGSKELNAILNAVYGAGTMMTGSMDPLDPIGMGHAADCLSFTLRCIGSPVSRHLLEIGCGRGYVLSELSKQGGSCVGLEPGDQISEVKGEHIELIRDFFPSSQLSGRRFDLVTSYNVIEHVGQVGDMLTAVHACLCDSGDFIFCVPNCGPYLASGDISIFLHEHMNYFSAENVVPVLARYGFEVLSVEVSKNQALLLVHARKGVAQGLTTADCAFDMARFVTAMQGLKDRLSERFGKIPDEEIAVYCPNRALNHLCQIARRDVRIIDDTPALLGRFFPYFSRPVENFEGLVAMPPSAICVFSFTHAEFLKERCRKNSALAGVDIFAISDFYG